MTFRAALLPVVGADREAPSKCGTNGGASHSFGLGVGHPSGHPARSKACNALVGSCGKKAADNNPPRSATGNHAINPKR
jgi:hypothetical protein